jgi:multiple sugar transport system substrate-binding protein
LTVLRGIGWDHRRCMAPLEAASRVWREERDVAIEWHVRSLGDFGDQPLEELAASFDLLTIDHPFVGTAFESACLFPLDDLMPRETLNELAEDSIGASHASYTYGGHQWALAVDAACQVAAARIDLLGDQRVPATWDSVRTLAHDLPGRVGLPLRPADAICSYVTLLANSGASPPATPERFAEPSAGVAALSLLLELCAYGNPECLELDPPALLELMTSSDELVYVPLTFGYSNYSRPDERLRPVSFHDIPSAGRGPVGSILGGAGLAVSSSSVHPDESAAFAGWICGAETQTRIVAPAGGQPGNRRAWLDPEVDRLTGRFTSATLASIEAAFVRPREPWWPSFQLGAGEALNAFLREQADPADTHDELERLYRQALAPARLEPPAGRA